MIAEVRSRTKTNSPDGLAYLIDALLSNMSLYNRVIINRS